MDLRGAFKCMMIGLIARLGSCQFPEFPDPATFGLNCTKQEFYEIGFRCLLGYSKSDAIADCKIQCSVIDDVVACVNTLHERQVYPDCRASLTLALHHVPVELQRLLFNDTLANSCGIDFNDAFDVCPGLREFTLPKWTAWTEFGACNESCVAVRSRQCLNNISTTPPEVSPDCSGYPSESQPCSDVTCVTPSAGVAPRIWCLPAHLLTMGLILLLFIGTPHLLST